jgi:hypothetical protein
MSKVSDHGVRVSYDVVGEGAAARAAARLVLRSFVVDRARVVDELRTDHRLINVDLRGYGASHKPHQPAA